MSATAKPWKLTAVAFQEEMCDNLSDVDWDAYEEVETHFLKNKIRMLLFGLPSAENEAAERKVDEICQVIIKENTCKFKDNTTKAVYMVFVFVVGTKDEKNIESWPVFRVPKDDTGINASFIDISCRVYESWKDFLENNKLPVTEYCYPKDGKYEFNSNGYPAIEFGQSPQTKTSKKVLKGLDFLSTGVGLRASALTIASLAVPVAAPLVAASIWAAGGVSAYCTYRSSTTLYDRKKHKQDIGLGDSEARNCYISIAGNTLGFGAAVATSATVQMAQSGRVMGKTATSAVTALSGGALVMNGVGIANGFHHLIEKHKEGQLHTLDVAQFSASLLLFCHSTVNFKTARSIIEKSQDSIIQGYGNSLGSRWKRIMFRTATKCTTILKGPGGKALVVRNIKHINTAEEYFACLLPEKESISHNHAVLISQSNITQINGFEHLESLLNEYDKVTLRRLLVRFIKPFREVILRLSESLFQALGMVRDVDFMHIVSFVSEFVNLLKNLILRGEMLYVLSLLQHVIRGVPNLSCNDYCLALFEQLVLKPIPLITIYKLVKSFIAVLSDRTQMTRELPNTDFIKLVSACGILLKTDKPYWQIIIDFAKTIFEAMNLKKHSSFVKILKELFLYIQESVLEAQKGYNIYRYESNTTDGIADTYDCQLKNDNENVLGTLYDEEVRTSFVNKLQGMDLDEDPEEGIPLRDIESVYTIEKPLSFQKCFVDREQLTLLTENEILETCKKTLRIDDLPQKHFITHDGLETFINIGDTVVVIRCDIHNEMVVSYAVLPSTSVIPNDAP